MYALLLIKLYNSKITIMPELNVNKIIRDISILPLKSFLIKDLFVEACLYMENQTPIHKRAIAHYYATIIFGTWLKVTTDAHNLYSKTLKIEEAHKPIIRFFEENILQSSHMYLSQYKEIILRLEEKYTINGENGVSCRYFGNLDKVTKRLSQVNKAAIVENKKRLLIEAAQIKKQNSDVFSIRRIFCASLAIFLLLESMEHEHSLRYTFTGCCV